MGKTYRTMDESTGNEVALKVLDFARVNRWKAMELFERGIEVLKSIDHPLIPNYIEHFKDETEVETLFVLVQEYVGARICTSQSQKEKDSRKRR